MGSLDSECVYRQRHLDCKKKTSTSPNRREKPLIGKTGWGRAYHRKRERKVDSKRETYVGRIQGIMNKEAKSLIDVENVETTGERCCHLS